MAADCSCDSRLLVAVFSAVILPSCAIDPVLSSTSATRSRVVPQVVVEEPLMVTVSMPSTDMKLVGTSAEPSSLIWEIEDV